MLPSRGPQGRSSSLMPSQGTHGMYASLNWAVEILPYVHLEADALTGRTFRVMPHWEFGGRLGISTRF